jgi:hypothetical protein
MPGYCGNCNKAAIDTIPRIESTVAVFPNIHVVEEE